MFSNSDSMSRKIVLASAGMRATDFTILFTIKRTSPTILGETTTTVSTLGRNCYSVATLSNHLDSLADYTDSDGGVYQEATKLTRGPLYGDTGKLNAPPEN